jgi:5-methylcytosine-specific restriction endonuclease McrA
MAAHGAHAEVCVIVGCLALNASFEPLTMVPVKRALRLVIDGKAEIVESDQTRTVRSARLTMPRPAVIRLTRFVHVPRRFRRQVTNTFLFARDRYRCQYCGRGQSELKPREALTRDHVIPISRGGTNEWTNVVTACSSCNLRKADHYVHECGMHPMTRPVEPHFVHLSWAVRKLTPAQARYIRVFYGEQTLHSLEVLEARDGRAVPMPGPGVSVTAAIPVLPAPAEPCAHGPASPD